MVSFTQAVRELRTLLARAEKINPFHNPTRTNKKSLRDIEEMARNIMKDLSEDHPAILHSIKDPHKVTEKAMFLYGDDPEIKSLSPREKLLLVEDIRTESMRFK